MADSVTMRPTMAGRYRHVRNVLCTPTALTPEQAAETISVIVTCKGRLRHLQHTLPSALDQTGSVSYEVIVVDYGDPDDCFSWVRNQGLDRLRAVRVFENTDYFNLSRARNCGANAATGRILCFVDADSILHQSFMDFATRQLRSGDAVLVVRAAYRRAWTVCGLCAVTADVFHAVRGYDESFEGWGPEDHDFYQRVSNHGRVSHFPRWLYPGTISHSNDERSRFYKTKDLRKSSDEICARMGVAHRVVNPNGYGRTMADIAFGGEVVARRLCEPASREAGNGV